MEALADALSVVEQAMKDGIVAMEVNYVITFERPRTQQEVNDLEDAIVAACCGAGHCAMPDGSCDPDVTGGGGFTHHFIDDPDVADWHIGAPVSRPGEAG